ncbi:MAG: DUF2905 family protein [Chthoniobacterales bacterium]|nr:DUF2905 family protein [Chthoniobacterales bacterium]
MPELRKLLVVVGALTVLLGLVLWSGFGTGWLPGDIRSKQGPSAFIFRS